MAYKVPNNLFDQYNAGQRHADPSRIDQNFDFVTSVLDDQIVIPETKMNLRGLWSASVALTAPVSWADQKTPGNYYVPANSGNTGGPTTDAYHLQVMPMDSSNVAQIAWPATASLLPMYNIEIGGVWQGWKNLVNATTTPAPNAVPQADENGLLPGGWLLRAAPTGFSGFYAGDTPPDGWFEENGAPVSRTTYAGLFAIIGTRFGSGDGSTTFNLPDSRALVKRVWDHGRGIDIGRALGSVQQDEIKNHAHALGAGYNNLATSASPNTNDVGRTDNVPTSAFYTAAFGGTENLVKNMALMGIIKY